MEAIKKWNGGVIVISHDERFISNCLDELWVCNDGKVNKFHGSVAAYKELIISSKCNMRPAPDLDLGTNKRVTPSVNKTRNRP